jgi:hypothetical protein
VFFRISFSDPAIAGRASPACSCLVFGSPHGGLSAAGSIRYNIVSKESEVFLSRYLLAHVNCDHRFPLPFWQFLRFP